MPGATPAGSPGGTGVSHCQQQALVVGRFVFPLSLVLGLSPRTRLSCSYRSSWCFLGLDRAGLHPAHGRDDCHKAHPVTTPAGARADLPKSRGEGRQPLAAQQRQLSHTAARCTAPSQRHRHFFFWVLALTTKSQLLTGTRLAESRICAFTTLFRDLLCSSPMHGEG